MEAQKRNPKRLFEPYRIHGYSFAYARPASPNLNRHPVSAARASNEPVGDEEVDSGVHDAEEDQRQQPARTLVLLYSDALVDQERPIRLEDASREQRRERRRINENGDGEAEEELEKQHTNTDPAPKQIEPEANTSPPHSLSHQNSPSGEANCYRQPSQFFPRAPRTADDRTPLDIINEHQPFTPTGSTPTMVAIAL